MSDYKDIELGDKEATYVTTVEASKMLGISFTRIVSKIKCGHFPGVCKCPCNRSLLIPIKDIEEDKKKTYRKSKNKPKYKKLIL